MVAKRGRTNQVNVKTQRSRSSSRPIYFGCNWTSFHSTTHIEAKCADTRNHTFHLAYTRTQFSVLVLEKVLDYNSRVRLVSTRLQL